MSIKYVQYNTNTDICIINHETAEDSIATITKLQGNRIKAENEVEPYFFKCYTK